MKENCLNCCSPSKRNRVAVVETSDEGKHLIDGSKSSGEGILETEEQTHKEEIEVVVQPATPKDPALIHHDWSLVKKKLSQSTQNCFFCNEAIGSLAAGNLMKCLQCLKKVHASCLHSNTDSDTHKVCKPALHKLWYTTDPECTPVIVFINAKSGGQQGNQLFARFRELLSPDQVFDLAKGGPSEGINKYKDVKNIKIIAAGGDGTVGWILMTLDKFNLNILPSVAVLPLGTGNDLARSLKWGAGYTGEAIMPIIKNILKAKVVQLDRWNINFNNLNNENKNKQVVMNNYFSVGVDARIAMGFHTLREQKPELCKTRTGNKLWYVWFGGLAAFQSSLSINNIVSLQVDGKEITIGKGYAGIIILNIGSYSSGAQIWGPTTPSDKSLGFVEPSWDDSLLEVCAIKGAVEMGLISAGLFKSDKLAQGNDIKITMKKSTYVQVDGEPWQQEPSTIHISLLNKANMLYNDDSSLL